MGGTTMPIQKQIETPLLNHAESVALWEKHNAAVAKARAVGACRRCALEMGMLATPDRPEDEPRNYVFHPLCLKRMESTT